MTKVAEGVAVTREIEGTYDNNREVCIITSTQITSRSVHSSNVENKMIFSRYDYASQSGLL